MKKYLNFFMILQLVFASLMATSHLALAGSGAHEKPHFHLLDVEDFHHHSVMEDSGDSEQVGEIHIHLSFLEASSFDGVVVSPVTIAVTSANVFFVNSLIKPLLLPPNI